ncbi:cysteine proteinase [Epithele typhae]|uniref:cysteine proteinase n=1 Tax=Epithele typhae TaxID=378194 RepID=UPI002007548D|nr:cysteine proteinase [Epithele typhae]KAH9939773.1 cysteine proteinase [Epithele typhae]
MNTSQPGHVESQFDLVGGPFAVIESDPGVFTTLIQKLGVQGLEVLELYSIEPFDTDHLNPYGLIFCYMCGDEETSKANEFGEEDDLDDPDANDIWFANQLSDDACASQAILNVLFNCNGIDLGPEMTAFAADTAQMSRVIRGLAISNSTTVREAQNSLARQGSPASLTDNPLTSLRRSPADLRGAFHALAASALESARSKAKSSAASSPAAKRRKTGGASASAARRKPARSAAAAAPTTDAYHYIGYVPARGRVWELDGLRAAGPLDVGALDGAADDGDPQPAAARAGWMDVVRPALRRRMRAVAGGGHIQYNLLALVDDAYRRASDELEMLKRERNALERRLAGGEAEWMDKVDPALAASAEGAFATSLRPDGRATGKMFSAGFGREKLEKEITILEMPVRELTPAWERCVRAALGKKTAVEEEIVKSQRAQADNVKRTHDYEPFIKEFIISMEKEGILERALNDAAGPGATERPAASVIGTMKSKSKGRARK